MSALPTVVELYYSGQWNDVTADVRAADGIAITRGRAGATQRVSPTQLTLAFNNHDSKYSLRNPEGELYGLIGRNTPIRVSVDGDYRFWGEIEAWPVRSQGAGKDVWVSVQAYGILRRLGAGASQAPAVSAVRRSITGASAPTPLVYLPLEDGADSVEAGSGIDGPSAPVNTRSVRFAATPPLHPGGPVGMLGFTSIGADENGPGDVRPVIPAHASTNDYVIGFFHCWMFDAVLDSPYPDEQKRVDPDITIVDPPDEILQARVRHRIGFEGIQWAAMVESRVTEDDDSIIRLLGSVTDEDVVWTIPREDNLDEGWHEIQFRFHQNGANIEIQLYLDGELREGVYFVSSVPQTATTTPIVTDTMGALTDVLPGRRADWYDPLIPAPVNYWVPYGLAHLYIYDDDTVGQWWSAGMGYPGEQAHDRIERIGDEEGVTVTVTGSTSALLGPQLLGSTVDILHDAADSDGGILREARGSLGLEYVTHTELYNQTAAATLDYDAREVVPPLDLVEDTDHVQNDVTATRRGGGSSRAVQTSGSLNVTDVGRYPVGVELSLYQDAQTVQQAAWRKHLGTWDEARVSGLSVNLAALDAAGETALVSALRDADQGSLLELDNPPPWAGPDSVRMHVDGYTETIGSHNHTVEFNGSPARPWAVGVLDTDRLGTSNSTIIEALDTTETDVYVITENGLWSESAVPYTVAVGGEHMTVTACDNAVDTGVTSPGTFAYLAQIQIPEGTYEIRWSVELSGTVGAPEVDNFGLIMEGNTGPDSDFYVSVNAGAVGVYPQRPRTITVPAGGGNLVIKTEGATPTTGATYTGHIINPQLLTVTRSANGVTKSHATGAPIQLAAPMRLARGA